MTSRAALLACLILCRDAYGGADAGGPRVDVDAEACRAWGEGGIPAVERAFHLFELPQEATPPPSSPPRRVLDRKTLLVLGGTVIVVPTIGYLIWWRTSTGGESRFTTANEGWFEETSYAGGADKVSHIFFGWSGQRIYQGVYRRLGHPPAESRWLALATVGLAGSLIEVGDGFTEYGFAWEDLAANVLGAAAAAGVEAAGLTDTIGFRMGLVKKRVPDPCCRFGGYGGDYSNEVYSLDVRLKGLLPRLGAEPGLSRFLLVSMTYGTKGYRYSPADVRQRNLGIDLGLNLPEVLRALGVSDSSWWGRPLLLALEHLRLPWTAFGFRYDLNHGRWHGPDTGDVFDPGYIIYD